MKMGVFGGSRGTGLYDSILANNAEIVAVCDANELHRNTAKQRLGDDVAVYADFDEFLEHEGMEAILLTNYFHEHAPFAIKALNKGIHVLSECLANSTMAQGVELVRAVEKSSATYMMIENYPFLIFNQEMRRLYREGTLGKLIYAEGEYNHPVDPDDDNVVTLLCPHSKHWRYQLPRSYYITHSLGPLVYITGAMPVRVTAMPAGTPATANCEGISKGVPEKACVITCMNDDGSAYRVMACSGFGSGESSYRICCEKGQMENLRDGTNRLSLNYSHWYVPENVSSANTCYEPVLQDKDIELAMKSGHGGGDFFVIREFLTCLRENRRPEFDVYFATTLSSVAILGHRSMLKNGMPYDIPDFRKEEDRVKYENDTLTPFYGTDGSEPTIAGSNREYYWATEEGRAEYDEYVKQYKEKINK